MINTIEVAEAIQYIDTLPTKTTLTLWDTYVSSPENMNFSLFALMVALRKLEKEGEATITDEPNKPITFSIAPKEESRC